MLEKNDFDPKKEILEKYNKFDLSKALTDEDFEEGLDFLAAVLLFGSQWEDAVVQNKKVRREFPLVDDMSLLCKATDCPFAAKCPILKKMDPANYVELLGTDCRADREFATRLFARYIKDLEVDPERFSDIMLLAQLVRHEVSFRRIDWQIAIDSPLLQVFTGSNESKKESYFKPEAHPLYKVQEGLSKQMKVIREQLLASRRDRMELAATFGSKGMEALRSVFDRAASLVDQNIEEAEFEEEE